MTPYSYNEPSLRVDGLTSRSVRARGAKFFTVTVVYKNHNNTTRLTVVYKHHNNTIRLTIQHKAALTTCVYR